MVIPKGQGHSYLREKSTPYIVHGVHGKCRGESTVQSSPAGTGGPKARPHKRISNAAWVSAVSRQKNYRGNTPTFHKRPASSLTKSSDMEKRKLDELTYKGAGPRCGQASSEMVLPSLLTKRTDFLGCGKE